MAASDDEPLELAFSNRREARAEAPEPVIPAPTEAAAPAPAPSPQPLPAPTGVRGHLRYTRAVWQWYRSWGERIFAEDAAVSRAVEARDAALAAVGDVARRLAAEAGPEADPELAAFALNLAGFELEATHLDGLAAQCKAEADAARSELEAAVGAFDARLSAVRAEAAPLEHARTLGARALDDVARLQTALTARQAKSPDAGVAADLERQAARHAELTAEQARLDTRIAALRKQSDALTDEQVLTRKNGERHLAGLLARAERAAADARGLQDRHRATRVDLGHEALRRKLSAPELAAPSAAAAEALSEVERVRTRREAVIAERRAIDLAPCVRTAIGVAVVAGGLLSLFLAL